MRKTICSIWPLKLPTRELKSGWLSFIKCSARTYRIITSSLCLSLERSRLGCQILATAEMKGMKVGFFYGIYCAALRVCQYSTDIR